MAIVIPAGDEWVWPHEVPPTAHEIRERDRIVLEALGKWADPVLDPLVRRAELLLGDIE